MRREISTTLTPRPDSETRPMSKYDARSLRKRKEQIDLFGDKSTMVVISRPERRGISGQQDMAGVAEHIATANPAMTCFDKGCNAEVHALNTFMLIIRDDGQAKAMTMAACEACSNKSNEDILAVIRTDLRDHGLAPASPADIGPVHEFEETAISGPRVAGIQLGVVGNFSECDPAVIIAALLEAGKLPMFASFYRGHNNCYVIVRQLRDDFKALGVDHKFQYRVGCSGVLKAIGDPNGGMHSWIEAEGWVIDASGGGRGNPVLFQRAEDYYRARQMTDIRDALTVAASDGGFVAGALTTS
jgi:hypothetical protein